MQRNYPWFLSFVYITTALCVWVFALSLVHLLRYSDTPDNSGRGFHGALSKYPASLVCMIYTFLAFWCARRRCRAPPQPPPIWRTFAMHNAFHTSSRSRGAPQVRTSQSVCEQI